MHKNNEPRCSFCNKTQNQVKKLIAAPGVFICDECVELCNQILQDEGLFDNPVKKEVKVKEELNDIPKPKDIKKSTR
ncbi:MAG: hypothetical protein KatS3mg068_0485 [Candidatus Sericytochromatia bacterium]|nr:MAG: hypothetical protein KatS3mg068_0485 [Candidatus Sericytochromatia bacterium]